MSLIIRENSSIVSVKLHQLRSTSANTVEVFQWQWKVGLLGSLKAKAAEIFIFVHRSKFYPMQTPLLARSGMLVPRGVVEPGS